MDNSLIPAVDRQFSTIAAHATVQGAIALLSQASQPCILVVDSVDFRFLGLVTERDIVQFMASGCDPTTRQVRAITSPQPLILREWELGNLDLVLTLFGQHQLTTLVVVDHRDQPVGLVTFFSLIQCVKGRSPRSLQSTEEQLHLADYRQDVDRALKRQLKHTLLLQSVTDAIRAQREPDQIFEATVTQIGLVFGVSYSHLLTYTSPSALDLTLAAEYSSAESPLPITELFLRDNAYVRQVLSQPHAIAVPNVYAHPLLQPMDELCQEMRLKSILTVCTSYQGQLNGVLVLYQCDRFRQWTSREIELIEAIAAQVGTALAQIELLEREKQQREAIEQQNLLLQEEINKRQSTVRNLQDAEERLELFFAQSLDGFFFMMMDQPVEWNDRVDKEKTLDYIFDHQRITKANDALLEQYGARADQFIGLTPNRLFAHDLTQGRRVWRQMLDTRKLHVETQEQTLDGKSIWVEGDYICLYDGDGRFTGHFGIQRDISDRKQMEHALRLIVEGTAAKTGREFFHSLVHHLARVLQVRYAFITEIIEPEKTKARTLAFWQNDRFGENFEYELAGTPCERVLAREIIYYRDSIQAHFPEHEHLAELSVESYFGIPLNDSLGNVIGHLKVLDTKPMPEERFSEQILRIFAARAGAELERQQAEDAITDLLAQTQEQSIALEKAKDAAESASRAKSEFLANMSHELRTPLNAILGFTQIMSHDNRLNPENQEYVNIINRSGQHLLTLINDVLEMSKIEAGRLKLYSANFDLYHLLDTLYEMLQLKASAKQLEFRFHRSPNLPRYISTDEGKLRQVLLNLLSNAIKFTQEGLVVLRVWEGPGIQDVEMGTICSLRIRDQAPLRFQTFTLFFEVEDTGSGIASEDLKWLFTPFVQTRTGQQFSEGTGLGLTISQRFVQLMGGDVTVESVLGQGSTFRFTIQATSALEVLSAPSSVPRRVLSLAVEHSPCRVMVVEDHWENQQVLVNLLEPVGFDVRVVSNGQDAIALWERWQPHAILMDMRMPVMDGYTATRHIRLQEQNQGNHPSGSFVSLTKIIAVTSSAFDEERSAILETGCDDFISKPFREDEIFTKLAEHLGLKYVYEDRRGAELETERQRLFLSSNRPTEETYTLDITSFQGLPSEWISQFHKATILGKDYQMLELIKQIPDTHSQLAQVLRERVMDFQFEEIVEVIKAFDFD